MSGLKLKNKTILDVSMRIASVITPDGDENDLKITPRNKLE